MRVSRQAAWPRQMGEVGVIGSMGSRTAPRVPQGNELHPAGYWRRDWIAVIVLFTFVVIRLPELFPQIAAIKPVFVTTLFIAFRFVVMTRNSIIWAALRDKVFLIVLAYVGWAIVIIPFAVWPGGSVKVVFILPFGVIMVGLVLLCAPTRRNLDRILTGSLMAGGLNAILVISGGVVRGDRLSTSGMYDPNDLGTLVAILLPFALVMAFSRKGFQRLVGVGAAVPLLILLLKTASRGGTIGVALGVLVLVAGLNPKKAMIGVVLTVVLGFGMWQYGPPQFRERMTTLTSLEEDYNVSDDVGRVGTWTRGVGYAFDNPITGLGPGNFAVAEGARQRENRSRGAYYTAHNVYVQAFAELGFIGGTLLVLALAVAGWRAFKMWVPLWITGPRRGFMPEIFASIVGFASSAFFLSLAYSYLFFGVLLIPILAYRVMLAENEGVVGGASLLKVAGLRNSAPAGRGGIS